MEARKTLHAQAATESLPLRRRNLVDAELVSHRAPALSLSEQHAVQRVEQRLASRRRARAGDDEVIVGPDVTQLAKEARTSKPTASAHPELIPIAIAVLGRLGGIEGLRLHLELRRLGDPFRGDNLLATPLAAVDQALSELSQIRRRKVKAEASSRVASPVFFPPPALDAQRRKQPPSQKLRLFLPAYALHKHAQQMGTKRIVVKNLPRHPVKLAMKHLERPIVLHADVRKVAPLPHRHGQ